MLKLPILMGFIVAACGTQNSGDLGIDSSASYETLADIPTTEQPAPPTEFTERKIIREGEIYFECRDVLETENFLKSEVKTVKGYISNESANSYGERTEKRLSIRIPSDQLDALLEKIQAHAVKIENTNIRSEDVTEQYIDVEARLKTKKELEIRYLSLLQQAKNVDEILQIERELSNIRGEIESMQGRLNYLKDRTSLSTLNVTFFVQGEKDFGFISKIGQGIKNGWTNLQWVIVFLVNLWPFFLGLALLLLFIWKRKKTPPPPLN